MARGDDFELQSMEQILSNIFRRILIEEIDYDF